MRIEFLKEWSKYRIGDTTEDVQSGVADVLFMRRIAKPTPAASSNPAPETIVATAGVLPPTSDTAPDPAPVPRIGRKRS